MKKQHSDYMRIAIEEAKKAAAKGEIPVGAVMVEKTSGRVIAAVHNQRETSKNPLGHAEILAIANAAEALSTRRLADCLLYVTLEPCPMCMGAVLNAGVSGVVFGAYDMKAGCCGSKLDMNNMGLPYSCEVLGGICELEAAELLKDFFKDKRKSEGKGNNEG